MLDVEYDEDDLDEMQGVREVYERSNKTLQNKMVIAGYVLYDEEKHTIVTIIQEITERTNHFSDSMMD